MKKPLVWRLCLGGEIVFNVVIGVNSLLTINLLYSFLLSGVLQDPALDGERLLLTAQPGAISGFDVSPTPSSAETVHVGAVSDDVCTLQQPCLNGGNCTNKGFQDYQCDCTGLEYDGRDCEKRDPCGRVADICAADMECIGVNTDGDAANGDEEYYCE